MTSAEADKLLAEYVAATSPSTGERLQERIIEDFARPLTTRIVRSALRGPMARQEADDVISETLVGLLRRLNDLKQDPATTTIADLRGYVATAAYHTCYEHLRQKAPGRCRLRNRVQYLVTHDPNFALQRQEGRTYCRYAGSLPAPNPSALRKAVVQILRDGGGTMELEQLVEEVARLEGLDATLELPLDAADVHAVYVTPEIVVEYRLTLRRLWEEVCRLPPKQRTALLLNLRDSDDRDVITLLPALGVATITRIAEALEMPEEELARMWDDLPLDDYTIAALLGATRPQVIKLRRLARERLRRRLAKLQSVKRTGGDVILPLPSRVPRPARSTYDEMQRVVDDTATAVELELIHAHNEDCVTCAGDLRDLATFRREIAR